MSYMKDPDVMTRGVRAIASLDAKSPRRARLRARRSMLERKRDRVAMALGAGVGDRASIQIKTSVSPYAVPGTVAPTPFDPVKQAQGQVWSDAYARYMPITRSDTVVLQPGTDIVGPYQGGGVVTPPPLPPPVSIPPKVVTPSATSSIGVKTTSGAGVVLVPPTPPVMTPPMIDEMPPAAPPASTSSSSSSSTKNLLMLGGGIALLYLMFRDDD